MFRRLSLWAVIGCALLLHGAFLMQRVDLERRNDTVELVLDDESLRRAASETGRPPAELWSRWQAVGLTSVAVGGADDRTEADDVALLDELRPVQPRIVPRTLAVVEEVALRGGDLGPYVARGEFIEGYPDRLDRTAAALAARRLPVGLVEFAVAAGTVDVVRRLGDDAVFVHSIPEKEMLRYDDDQAVARFYRAVFERQARLLYIHLPGSGADRSEPVPEGMPSSGTDPARLARYDDYIAAVVRGVERAGLRIGPTSSAPVWDTPWWLAGVAAAAAGAAGALLLPGPTGRTARMGMLGGGRARRRLDGTFWRDVLFVFGPVAVVGVLFALDHAVAARQGTALAAALVFPVFAMAWAGRATGLTDAGGGMFGWGGEPAVGWLSRAGRFFLGMLVVAVVSAAGAVLVAGALGETAFLLKLETFRGVKLAHVVPFLLLTSGWMFGIGLDESFRPPAMSWRIRWTGWHVVLVLLVLAVGFVVIARTGHDVLPVSQWERAMREWLETTLPVRPRTKEFLIGWPALVIGLYWAAFARDRRNRGWAVPFLIAGALTPISIVNTFAHAHVPLHVSVVRSLLGWVFGAAVGVFLLPLASGLRRRVGRSERALGQ